MAASNGMSALGTTLKFAATGDTGFTSATTVAEVISVNPTGLAVEKVDLTHLNSDDDAEESTYGLLRPGQIEVVANWNDSDYDTLYNLLQSVKLWRITFPDSSTFDCEGYITALEIGNVDKDTTEGIRTTMTIQLTGKPTFSTG